MNKKKTVLVAPLNWGLGHATRIVPIIETLLNHNSKVIIAADKRPYEFLKQRFPDIEIIRFPGFEPEYTTKASMALKMVLSFPLMLKKGRDANKMLQKIIIQHDVDIIISDNRFEAYSQDAYCVFITHQLNVQTQVWQRFFKPIITKLINNYIKHYDELWIPDYENPEQNLTGKLSHIKKFPIKNYHFISPLSRFEHNDNHNDLEKNDLLIILSGPEPQRTKLENLLIKQVLQSNLRTTILQSKPEENKNTQKENIKFISHASDKQIAALIKSARMIISRPGYSTVMDLSVFGKKAIFIPTPGQTEQEYLAKKLKNQGYCYYEKQKIFNLNKSLSEAENYTGLPKLNINISLENHILRLLS